MERRPPRTRRHGALISLLTARPPLNHRPTQRTQALRHRHLLNWPVHLGCASGDQTPLHHRRPEKHCARTIPPVDATQEKARERSHPPTQRLTSNAGCATSCVYSFPTKQTHDPAEKVKNHRGAVKLRHASRPAAAARRPKRTRLWSGRVVKERLYPTRHRGRHGGNP